MSDSMKMAITVTENRRIVSFDVLKGIAAYLVVLGHIVTGKEEYRGLYNFIYSFHMPLFMFLAGCTVVISFRNSSGKITYLARRFVNIMLPYLIWSVCLPVIAAGSFREVDWKNVLVKTFITNRMFWFLPTLYGLITGYVCCCRIRECIWNMGNRHKSNEWMETVVDGVSCICVTGIFVLLMFITKYQLCRDIVGFTIPFFAAVMYMEHKWVYQLFHQRALSVGAIIVFALLIGRFDFDRVCVATSILRMILGMCAVVILLQLFEGLCMPDRVCGLLVFWGRSSLLIYILHSRVWSASRLLRLHGFGTVGNLVWYCAVSFLICCICGVFTVGLSHVPIARILFLGKMGGGYAKRL